MKGPAPHTQELGGASPAASRGGQLGKPVPVLDRGRQEEGSEQSPQRPLLGRRAGRSALRFLGDRPPPHTHPEQGTRARRPGAFEKAGDPPERSWGQRPAAGLGEGVGGRPTSRME